MTDSNEQQGGALEPCPFCDGVVQVQENSDLKGMFRIACRAAACKIWPSTPWYTNATEVITLWNTRSRASLAAVEGDAQQAIDHWVTMYNRVAADNTELINRLAQATEDGDLISRKEAVRVARDHDRRHDSGYRCYEGEVIAKKIAALPACRSNVVTAAKMVSQVITEAGFNDSTPSAKSWEEGKHGIPAAVSSPLPAEPPRVPVACGVCKFHWGLIVMPGDTHNPACPYFTAAPAEPRQEGEQEAKSMTVTKERAMQMFDRDLEILLDDLRGMQAHYQIADWEAFVFLCKPDCPESYVVKYAAADDAFANQIVKLHAAATPVDAPVVAAKEGEHLQLLRMCLQQFEFTYGQRKRGWDAKFLMDQLRAATEHTATHPDTSVVSESVRAAAEAVGEYLQAPPSMWDTIERLITQRLGNPVVAATRATEELLRENFLLSDVTAEEFNKITAIITRCLVGTPLPETPDDDDLSVCLKCKHFDSTNDRGVCQKVRIVAQFPDGFDLICGCKCEFTAPVVATDDVEGAGDPLDNEAVDTELRRWQDGIRDKLIDLGVPDHLIDGAGCDSGDPLDFTLVEVGQGVRYFVDQLDELKKASQ